MRPSPSLPWSPFLPNVPTSPWIFTIHDQKLPSATLLVTESSLWGYLLRTLILLCIPQETQPSQHKGLSTLRKTFMHNSHSCHAIEHALLAPWSFLSLMALLFFNCTIMDLGDCMINIYPPYVSCLQKWVCFAHFNEENCSVRSSNNLLGSLRILHCPQLRNPQSQPSVKPLCIIFASPCFDTRRQYVSDSWRCPAQST